MRDGDLAVMAARVGPSGMALKHHPMRLHHPVDALGVDRGQAFLAALALEHRPDAAIAIGRLIADDRLDPGDEFLLRGRRPPNPLMRPVRGCLRASSPSDSFEGMNRHGAGRCRVEMSVKKN